MKYWVERVGLRRFLHLVDKGGKPVAVVEMESTTLRELLSEFL